MPLDPALVLWPARESLTSLSFSFLTLEMRQLKPDDLSQKPKHWGSVILVSSLMVEETEPWELKCLAHCDVVRKWHNRGQRPGALSSPGTFPSPPTALQRQEEFVTFCRPEGAGGAVGSWVLSPHFHIFVCFCLCLHLLNCHKMCMLWTSPFSPEGKQNCMTHPFFVIKLCQDHVHPGPASSTWDSSASLSLRDGARSGGWGALADSLPESAWAQTIFPPGWLALINISSLLVSWSKAGSIKIHWPFDTKAYKSCEFLYLKRKTLVYDLGPSPICYWLYASHFIFCDFMYHPCKNRNVSWITLRVLSQSEAGFLSSALLIILWLDNQLSAAGLFCAL